MDETTVQESLTQMQKILCEAQAQTDDFNRNITLSELKFSIDLFLNQVRSQKNHYGKHLPRNLFWIIYSFLKPKERAFCQLVCRDWFQDASRYKGQGDLFPTHLTFVSKNQKLSENFFLDSGIAIYQDLFYYQHRFYDETGKEQVVDGQHFFDHFKALNVNLSVRINQDKIAFYEYDHGRFTITNLKFEVLKYWNLVDTNFENFDISESALFIAREQGVQVYDFAGNQIDSWKTNNHYNEEIRISSTKELMILASESKLECFNLRGEFQWEVNLWTTFQQKLWLTENWICVGIFNFVLLYDFQGKLLFETFFPTQDQHGMFFLNDHLCFIYKRQLARYRLHSERL